RTQRLRRAPISYGVPRGDVEADHRGRPEEGSAGAGERRDGPLRALLRLAAGERGADHQREGEGGEVLLEIEELDGDGCAALEVGGAHVDAVGRVDGEAGQGLGDDRGGRDPAEPLERAGLRTR